MEELRAAGEAAIKELEQLQNEKRKMLMEHETLKLKEQDEENSRELKEWKAQLKPRKQVRVNGSFSHSLLWRAVVHKTLLRLSSENYRLPLL